MMVFVMNSHHIENHLSTFLQIVFFPQFAENRVLEKRLEQAKIEISELNQTREQIMVEIESLRTKNRQLHQENNGAEVLLEQLQG